MAQDWKEKYYAELEQAVALDPIAAVQKDTRIYDIAGQKWLIGQMELWDGGKYALTNGENLKNLLKIWAQEQGANLGFINIPSIKDGWNYMIILNPETEKKLSAKVVIKQVNSFLWETEQLFLRKELFKLLNQPS